MERATLLTVSKGALQQPQQLLAVKLWGPSGGGALLHCCCCCGTVLKGTETDFRVWGGLGPQEQAIEQLRVEK